MSAATPDAAVQVGMPRSAFPLHPWPHHNYFKLFNWTEQPVGAAPVSEPETAANVAGLSAALRDDINNDTRTVPDCEITRPSRCGRSAAAVWIHGASRCVTLSVSSTSHHDSGTADCRKPLATAGPRMRRAVNHPLLVNGPAVRIGDDGSAIGVTAGHLSSVR